MSAEHTGQMADCHTLLDILRWRGTNQSARRAFTFLPDGETEEFHLTYGALDRRARAIAATLEREAPEAQRALLLCPPGLDYVTAFCGCLYAAVTAVPACPPDPASPERVLPRLRAIALDAAPAVIITTNSISSITAEVTAGEEPFSAARWLTTDSVTDAASAEWRQPVVHSDTLALLQYTPGSTAAPKGVLISHGNLMHNEAFIQRALSATEESSCVTWLPLHHNMGLIGTVLQAVYAGFPCTLISPGDFLRKPVRWLQAITRYRATLSGAPNFAYDLCINKVTPEQRTSLDLRSWDIALNGGEPIQLDTLEGFAAAFGRCGFRREAFFSCYGLAEATWMASGGPTATLPAPTRAPKPAAQRDLVAGPFEAEEPNMSSALARSGQISPDQTLLIVDPETRTRCKDGEINEIWLAGPGVAMGYRNMPQATNETFMAYLDDSGEGPFLRTGDLGFLQDGDLFVIGRQQVIGDSIDSQKQREPECEDGPDGQIVAALLEMEPAQRFVLLATYLRQRVASVLAVPPSDVSEDRPFMAMGLNSLGLLGLKGCIETDLGVEVSLASFIDHPTVGQLATLILDTLEQGIEALLAEVGQLTDEEVDLRLKQFTVKEQ